MVNSGRLKFVKQVLYNLNRLYGGPLDFYRYSASFTNLETGIKDDTFIKIPIKRAIRLPKNIQQKFDYDLSYIAANKNFTYGALYLLDTRTFIIESRFLDRVDMKDYIAVDGIRYDLKMVEELDNKSGWLIVANEVHGSQPLQQHNVTFKDSIQFGESYES